LCLPASLIGRVKVGGAQNTLSPFLYFLVASLLVILREGYERHQEAARYLICTALAVLALSALTQWYSLSRPSARMPLEDEAYHYAKSHPGTTYFPDFAFSSCVAERKVYHSGFLVAELDYAGFKVPEAQLRAGLPETLEQIAVPPAALRSSSYNGWIPGYPARAADRELPEWTLYRRREK
jgi:hypothetical protein